MNMDNHQPNSSNNTDIELRPTGAPLSEDLHRDIDQWQQQPPLQQQSVQLKPVDRGWHAWKVLMAAFVFEALFWGFPTSFGVFQAYYSSLPQFRGANKNIPVIGTLAQALYYLGAPFAAAMTKRFSRYHRHMIIFGWLLCISALLGASFTNTVAELIVTQGFIYGVGFVTLTYPILSMLNEWWVSRKGLAFGLISAASGLTGIAMPLILEALLHKYGYKITLRACAIAMVVLTTPLVPLLEARLPVTEATRQPKVSWAFLRKPLFWCYAAATTIQGFGFFIPPVFLPSYAVSVGVSSTNAALLLAVMATMQTLGPFALGWLSDKNLHASILTTTCCIASAIATATLWGLGKSLGILMLFSVFYGCFAFGFGTLRVAMGRAVTTEQSNMLTIYSIFVFLQGIGNVMVGPVTAALMSDSIDLAEYGAAQYKGMVVFVAATAVLAAIVIVTHHVLRLFASILKQMT